MDRLKALLGEAQRYFQQLSQRERLAVGVAGGTSVLFVISIILTSLSHSISHHEIAIDEKMGSLQRISIYAQSFAENDRQRREMEQKLSGPPVKIMSELEKFTGAHEITITAMNDRGDRVLDRVKESEVDLQIGSTTIDKLTALLNDIEHDRQILKVRKLRIHQTSADKTVLNVSMTVGAYQLAPKT